MVPPVDVVDALHARLAAARRGAPVAPVDGLRLSGVEAFPKPARGSRRLCVIQWAMLGP
jgi:hypothetical protein